MFAKKSSHFCVQLCTLYYRGQVHIHMPTSCAFLNDFTLLPFTFQYTFLFKKKKVVLIKIIQLLFMEECSCNKSLFLSLLNLSATRVWKRSKGKGDKHKSDVRDSACGSAQMLHTKMSPLTVDAVQANHGIFLSSFTWQREGGNGRWPGCANPHSCLCHVSSPSLDSEAGVAGVGACRRPYTKMWPRGLFAGTCWWPSPPCGSSRAALSKFMILRERVAQHPEMTWSFPAGPWFSGGGIWERGNSPLQQTAIKLLKQASGLLSPSSFVVLWNTFTLFNTLLH